MELADVHRWHEEIFTRMAKAGWVESFAYSEGKGWFVTWTALGAGHSQVLKALCDKMGLLDADVAAVAFDAVARDLPFPKGVTGTAGNIHPMVKEAWREAVDPLGLAGDEDGLLILIHLVTTYAPNHTTPVKGQADV